MNQSTTQEKVKYLLQGATLAEALQDDTATRTAQFLELPVEEIDKLCIAEFESRRELVERWRFYNQPHASADFELFGKVGHWTPLETVALLLGKDSDFVNWHYLREFQAHDEQAFADFQSLGIADIALNHYLTKRYLKLCVILSRAEVFIPKTRDVDPVSALSWARDNDISIPASLTAAFAGKNARAVTGITPATQSSVGIPAASSKTAPEPQAAPVMANASGGDDGWKAKAQEQAKAIIKRDKLKDLYPSQKNIADEIAREFRINCVNGSGGKPLTGAYIKRHALKGISSEQGKQVSTAISRGK